jgi:hypothetical protein
VTEPGSSFTTGKGSRGSRTTGLAQEAARKASMKQARRLCKGRVIEGLFANNIENQCTRKGVTGKAGDIIRISLVKLQKLPQVRLEI